MFESFDFSSFVFGAFVFLIAQSFQKSTVHLVLKEPLPLPSQILGVVAVSAVMFSLVFQMVTGRDMDGDYVAIAMCAWFLRLVWLSRKAPLNS